MGLSLSLDLIYYVTQAMGLALAWSAEARYGAEAQYA